MTLDEIQEKIEALAQKVFAKEGMDLLDIKLSGHPKDIFIQITADKPSGSINIKECAILNKSLVAAIEEEKTLPPDVFSLELSSPGLDRPLVTPKDFMRVKGQHVHFWLTTNVGSKKKKEIEGLITDVSALAITIDAKGDKNLSIPMASIIKGILVI